MDFYLVHQNYDYERNERQMCYYGRMGERCEVRLRMREKTDTASHIVMTAN